MEHILKVVSREELSQQTVVINEYLGASSDFLIGEIAKEYPNHLLLSYYDLAAAYPQVAAVSALPHPTDTEKVFEKAKTADLLMIDGYNLGPRALPKLPCTVVLINRSITQPPFREMYQALLVVSVRPLLTAELLYSGSLQVDCRPLSRRVDLLYRSSGQPGSKTEYSEE